jgi:hypothetical protein
VGFIEAEGFVPIFDAVDAMTKATEVDICGTVRLGGGLVAVAVSGELATVEEAVEIGEETATDTGTPSINPAGSPRRQRSSDARAASSAPSVSRRQNALTAGSSRRMRSRTERVASTGDSSPARNAATISVAERSAGLTSSSNRRVALSSEPRRRKCHSFDQGATSSPG